MTVGRTIASVRLIQALAAALVSALVAAAVARTLAGKVPTAAAAAGALVAGLAYGLYAPGLFHDGFVYRDGLLAHGSTALLLLPLLVPAFGPGALFGVGLGAGLLTLLKQTAAPVALAALAVAIVRRRGARGPAIGAALAGLLIPLGALAARNVSAGVPPFVFDTRQAFTFVWAHGRGGGPMRVPPPEALRILDRTGPSTLRTALAVWESWRGERAALLRLEANKAIAFFQTFEPPDNASFDFYRSHLPLLAFLPAFPLLLGPGLAGLVAASRARLLHRDEAALLWVGLLVPLASTVVALALSRYRVPVAGPLAVGAGLGVGLILDRGRVRRGRAVAGVGAALVVSLITLTPPVIDTPRHRWVDTIVLISLLEDRGAHAEALAEADRYLALGTDDIDRERGLRQIGDWKTGKRGVVALAPVEP